MLFHDGYVGIDEDPTIAADLNQRAGGSTQCAIRGMRVYR
jgi:hypothetical protein